jgi:hypothetical protein
MDQKHDIRPPRFERQLVLQDGGALIRGRVRIAQLPHLPLEERDGVVPGAELLDGSIGDEAAEAGSDHARLGVPELGEERIPSVIGLGRSR